MTELSRPHQNVLPRRAQLPLSVRSLVLLWMPGGLISSLILLPILYLVIRAGQGSQDLAALFLRSSNFVILANSLALALTVSLLSAALALPLAWLTVRTDLPFRRLWSVLTALPLVIPSYIGAYLLVSTLGPRGLIQGWLEGWFGIQRLPSIYGFPGAVAVLTLLNFPYTLLAVRTALKGIDPSLEEAGRVLGHSAQETFLRVTLPQLRPALAAGSLLVGLYCLRDFGAVAILRYNTFTRAIFLQYQSLFDRSSAAALALVLIGITILVLIVERRLSQNRMIYSTPDTRRLPAILPLGRWKWPALIFCTLVVLFSLVFPAANLIYWLVETRAAAIPLGDLMKPLWNSILVSGLAAGLILMAALPVATLSVRHPGRLTYWIERTTYLGFALPGVVIALALVFVGANYVPWLYQTLGMLLLAYLILFLAEAIAPLQAAMLQVHPNLEEAGRSLGKPPLEVFRRVVLPIVRPGLSAGAAMVFLTALKELPATLLLGPSGFKTLATSIWGAVSEAAFARAAAPALLLVLVSSIPTAVLVLRRRL